MKSTGNIKPTGKKKPKAVRIVKIPKKRGARPRWRIWAGGGGAALVLVLAGLMLWPAGKDVTPTPLSGRVAGSAGDSNPLSPVAPVVPPDNEVPEKQLAFIKAVRLKPSEPTRLDSLKAEVAVAAGAPAPLVYTYLWKVNDRIVEGAKGDTLDLSDLKKRDCITVTVTPYDGDTAGFAVESLGVAIQGIAPSLELEIKRPASKIREPVEMQLVSVAPDSDRVTFSLETPHLPGMTIDKRSGKISWLRQSDRKGVFRFGASVEDDNGTKVTKTFEINLK